MIWILRGRRSASDMSCYVVVANRIVGAASSGDNVQISWQAQYFKQVDWKNRKTQWYEAVNSALNFPYVKEVSQKGFVFKLADCTYIGR